MQVQNDLLDNQTKYTSKIIDNTLNVTIDESVKELDLKDLFEKINIQWWCRRVDISANHLVIVNACELELNIPSNNMGATIIFKGNIFLIIE